jgi:hypothetical protein
MMADQYAYDAGGYTARGAHEPEVMGRGRYADRPHQPFWTQTYEERGPDRPRRVVIRQRNGRLVLEVE